MIEENYWDYEEMEWFTAPIDRFGRTFISNETYKQICENVMHTARFTKLLGVNLLKIEPTNNWLPGYWIEPK